MASHELVVLCFFWVTVVVFALERDQHLKGSEERDS